MPKRASNKPKVAIKREQRLLAGSDERSNFTEGKIEKQVKMRIFFIFNGRSQCERSKEIFVSQVQSK